jgi:tRNA threonylcarbamoyl adenosine modification protein YeaZ
VDAARLRLSSVLTLAFDTSTPAVTVAVLRGEDVVGESQQIDARRHGELLAPGIGAAMREASLALRDLDVVAVGNGPGPFTGLRVGLVTARTLSHALGVPAYGVCSLDALAAASGPPPLVVATDARRREVYWARYDAEGARVAGPAVDTPAALAEELAAYDGRRAGHGIELYADALGPRDDDSPLYPAAEWIGRLVVRDLTAGRRPDDVAPLYLRRPDAQVPKPPKAALPG